MGAVSAFEVTIGNEEGASYQLPVNMYYNYSLTQQIYTAEEIGTPGFIQSISFNYANTRSFSKEDVRVYLKEVEKSAFDSDTDMVPVSDADLYFEGTFSATRKGWVTINLDKPFEYSGTRNLLVCFYDPTKTYQGSDCTFCYSNTTDNTSLTYYSDVSCPDIDDLQSYSGNKGLKKFRSNIKLEFSSGSIEKTLTVCDGTETNQYVPLDGNYADYYQKCEFIIPANKLNEMEDNALSKMTFYLSSPAQGSWGSAKFKVFLKEVDNTTITDYYGTSGATVVYEGSLDGTKNTMDIAFTTPYTYQGGNLLVGVYQTVKGTDNSATFIGTYAQNASIQGMNDTSLDNISINRYNFIPKTTFSYIYTIATCQKPTDLTVTNIDFNNATVSWTSDAEQWDLRYKSSYDERWTKVYGLTSKTYSFNDMLPLSGTRYEVQVRSNCGGGDYSVWASTSFVTTICDEQNRAAISYELTDSYGDSWNGNAINIVHSNTGLVVATLDMTKEDGKKKKGTVDLCLGQDYDFVWVKGKYGEECGFTIKDNFGEDILVHEKGEAPEAGLMTTYGVTWWDPDGKRPTNLAIAEGPGPDRVTLTWTPGSESQTTWEFDYVKVGEDTHCGVDNVQTGPPYEFTGLDTYPLEPNTTYKVKMRSSQYDAGGASRWSNIITFTTSGKNPIPSQLKVEATYNSATISWVGYSYQYIIKYRKKGETSWVNQYSNLKTVTLTSLNPKTEYEYQIVGIAYPNTENAGTTVATFTTSSFTAPQKLKVSDVAPTAATVSWTSDANVDMQYAQLPENVGLGEWMHYDSDDYYTSIGASGSNFSWAVMFPAGTYGSGTLKKVSIYDSQEMIGTISIYNIETAPSDDDTPIATKNIELTGAKKFVNFSFDEWLDNTQNVWVVINNESGASYPAAASKVSDPDPDGQWVWLDDSWMNLSEVGSLGEDVFMVRALIGDDIDPSIVTWTDVADANSPKQLTGLSTNTPYIIRMKANDGQYESDWVMKSFITLPDNPVPFDLTAEAETNTATISWMGYSTKYNVRYRIAATLGALFFDDFENGMDKWTVIRNGEEGNEHTDWRQVDPLSYFGEDYGCKVHSGSYAAITRSWYPEGYHVDNWLITPKVTLDGTLQFWVLDDGDFHEHYDVYVSTTTDDISAFTLLHSPGDASSLWKKVTVDLSSFHGQEGYIALRNQDYDKNYLLVDDFGIYADVVPAGNWSSFTVSGVNSIVALGLNPSTTYEYQVQGVKGSATSEWSPIAKFTTLEAGITTGLEAIDNGQLTIDNANDGWFTIDGQKLSGKPTKKGIYIHNGRKTVLK